MIERKLAHVYGLHHCASLTEWGLLLVTGRWTHSSTKTRSMDDLISRYVRLTIPSAAELTEEGQGLFAPTRPRRVSGVGLSIRNGRHVQIAHGLNHRFRDK
jgi:hypothetical protein